MATPNADHGQRAAVQPGRGTRFGSAALAAAAAASLLLPGASWDVRVRGLVAFVLLVVAVRSLRLGLQVDDGTVIYRGYLLTRRVPSQQVRRVTDFPCLVWESASGRTWSSPMLCFVQSDRFPVRPDRGAGMLVEQVRACLRSAARGDKH